MISLWLLHTQETQADNASKGKEISLQYPAMRVGRKHEGRGK